MPKEAASAPSSVYVSGSSSASSASTTAPTGRPGAVFSATSRVVPVPSANSGAVFDPPPVRPVPDADQSLGVSPFSARTRTAYSVSSASVPMVAVVPVPEGVVSVHEPLPETSYRSL